MTPEERSLIPLVSSGGCVDIRILRIALEKTKKANPNIFCPKLFIYHYLKESDPDGDEPMQDVE
jgi:hypothetical protein